MPERRWRVANGGRRGRFVIRVSTREEFDDALEELFGTGRPIEAPSVEALEAWAIDLEDEGGSIEGL